MNDQQKNGIGEFELKDNQLKSFIERIERLKEEKYNDLSDIKEVYSEATSTCYDPKIMRKVLTTLNIDTEERLEQDTLLDTCKNALGILKYE